VGVARLPQDVRRGYNGANGALTGFLPVAKFAVAASAFFIIGHRIVYTPSGA
jgi:hypothetical protein